MCHENNFELILSLLLKVVYVIYLLFLLYILTLIVVVFDAATNVYHCQTVVVVSYFFFRHFLCRFVANFSLLSISFGVTQKSIRTIGIRKVLIEAAAAAAATAATAASLVLVLVARQF